MSGDERMSVERAARWWAQMERECGLRRVLLGEGELRLLSGKRVERAQSRVNGEASAIVD